MVAGCKSSVEGLAKGEHIAGSSLFGSCYAFHDARLYAYVCSTCLAAVQRLECGDCVILGPTLGYLPLLGSLPHLFAICSVGHLTEHKWNLLKTSASSAQPSLRFDQDTRQFSGCKGAPFFTTRCDSGVSDSSSLEAPSLPSPSVAMAPGDGRARTAGRGSGSSFLAAGAFLIRCPKGRSSSDDTEDILLCS